MNKPSNIILLTLVLTLGSGLTTEAWCNRKGQPGTQDGSGDTFELPEVQPTDGPFDFAKPDPRRLLRQLEYSIDRTKKSVFQVAVSDDLSPQQAADVQANILEVLSLCMCNPDDTLVVWSGAVRRVATFRNDERIQDCTEKWLKHKIVQNRAELARFNQYFQAFQEGKESPGRGKAALDIPHLVHHLGQEFHEYPDYPNRILVIFGSAIYGSGGEGAAFLETAYPTVGMLRAPLSAFSTRDKAWYLGNTVTHFVHLDTIRDRVHRDGLQNFWSAFFLSQGSPLLTFSSDPKISERVLNSQLPVIAAYVDDVNPGYVAVVSSGLFDDFAGRNRPSQLDRGSLVIGLKWPAREIDLDVHVGLRGQGERLSFRNAQTGFGQLQKDPSTDWEQVVLNREVSPDDLEVWVNFFKGQAPPEGATGELRVAYAGSLFRVPVAFPDARQGNGGQVGSPAHWQEIDLAALLSGRN